MSLLDFTEAVALVSGGAVLWIAAAAIALGLFLSVLCLALYITQRNF